mgnify:CR=1 FL=1|tara:strand:- start:333 stop:1103 length:771 start_codon:yes stop_codon:yes gene_type:complete
MSTLENKDELESQIDWFIENLQAVEDGTLTDRQRNLFLDLLDENTDCPLVKVAFKKWQFNKSLIKTQKLRRDFMELSDIIKDVKCNNCDGVLPPHTLEEHFNMDHPIHNCPTHKEEVKKDEEDLSEFADFADLLDDVLSGSMFDWSLEKPTKGSSIAIYVTTKEVEDEEEEEGCKSCDEKDIELCPDCGECADPSRPSRCCECEEEEEVKDVDVWACSFMCNEDGNKECHYCNPQVYERPDEEKDYAKQIKTKKTP